MNMGKKVKKVVPLVEEPVIPCMDVFSGGVYEVRNYSSYIEYSNGKLVNSSEREVRCNIKDGKGIVSVDNGNGDKYVKTFDINKNQLRKTIL